MDINKLLSRNSVNGVTIKHINRKNNICLLSGKIRNAEKDKKKMDNMAQQIADYYTNLWGESEIYKCVPYIGFWGEYCIIIKRYFKKL